jgi:biopolymer transport protein ExbD
MAEKRRFFDVWIVESNTVYQEVPYEVVADWLQQGRLLGDDMLKPSGTKDWSRIAESAEFRPYVLTGQPNRPEDQAEAMEPLLESGLNYRRPPEEEDEDVDMIPLIDVSLVLLIYFMMSATTGGEYQPPVQTPGTDTGQMVLTEKGVRIDITPDTVDGEPDYNTPLYAVAEGTKKAPELDRDIRSLAAVLDRVDQALKRRGELTEVIINLDRKMPAKFGRDILVKLRAEKFRKRISNNYFGVRDKE